MLRFTLSLLLAATLFAAEKKPVTIAIAASPPATPDAVGQPVWAPDGRSFAWLASKKLWLYDIAAKSRREIASTAPLESAVGATERTDQPFAWENRRVSEQNLQWTHDGRSLLLLVSGDLFLMEVGSAKWERLTTTAEAERDPKLSPDGTMVSFQRGNELHVLELASRKVRQLTHDSTDTVWNGRLDWVYPEELGLGTAHWWSPDSKRIAFLQFDVSREWIYPHADLLTYEARTEPQRYPKAGTPNPDVRLGIIPVTGGKVTWADCGDPRESLLARVNWLPDSKQVAVQKLNRVQNVLTLLFADAASGAATPVLTERDPHWIDITDDLRFLPKRNAFLRSSQESGFNHLYLYSMDGKRQRRLTNGEWAVGSVVGVDRDEKTVYFTSRERNPLGVDLAAVDLNGRNHRLITEARGQHSIAMSPGAEYFIDNYSSLTEPPRKILRDRSGSSVAMLQPPNPAFEEYTYVKPEIVQVKTADGATLYGRLIKPAGFDASKKYPAIVSVYGGPHSQSVCDCFGGLKWEQAMAQRGYVMWALDNRGTSGRGHAFETKLYRRFGKQELEDQRSGIQHLIGLGFVDPARIGMTGWSYGGFMTLYTLFNDPGLIRAGFAGAPVTDWRLYDTIYTERYLGLPQENPEGYRLSSPLHQAAQLKSALMLAHNFYDDNVLFQNTFQLIVELQKAGKQFETMLYPQKSHGVSGPLQVHLLETETSFFERHLK